MCFEVPSMYSTSGKSKKTTAIVAIYTVGPTDGTCTASVGPLAGTHLRTWPCCRNEGYIATSESVVPPVSTGRLARLHVESFSRPVFALFRNKPDHHCQNLAPFLYIVENLAKTTSTSFLAARIWDEIKPETHACALMPTEIHACIHAPARQQSIERACTRWAIKRKGVLCFTTSYPCRRIRHQPGQGALDAVPRRARQQVGGSPLDDCGQRCTRRHVQTDSLPTDQWNMRCCRGCAP